MSNEIARKIFRSQQPCPHGFNVALSEEPNFVMKDGSVVHMYFLLFKNSEYQKLAGSNRQAFVDVARWLKQTHDMMQGMGLHVVVQPIFDTYTGLQADNLKWKSQFLKRK